MWNLGLAWTAARAPGTRACSILSPRQIHLLLLTLRATSSCYCFHLIRYLGLCFGCLLSAVLDTGSS